MMTNRRHDQMLWKSLGFTAVVILTLTLGLVGHLGLASSASFAQQGGSYTELAPRRYAEARRQGRTAVRAMMEMAGIPGMSVDVARNGEIIWSEGFGYADLEHRAPVTPLTRFRIASVSKVVTAAAVARLNESGKLDLDAPIQRYAPSFPDKGHTITTRQLTGQLGGIRHYEKKDHAEGQNIDFKHYDTTVAALAIFKDDPLIAAPGARYNYSTFGYTLVGAVVEAACGRDFLACVSEYVFQPLRMRQTVADDRAYIVPYRSSSYQMGDEGRIVNAPYMDSSYKRAAGGFVSTAEDLVLFGSAHLRPGFLKAETLDLLFTSQRTSSGQETGVGIGWRMMTDLWGRRFVHHSGSQPGSRSVLVVYRDAGVVVALLSNLSGTPGFVEGTAQAIAEPFLRALEGDAATGEKVEPAGIYNYVMEGQAGAANKSQGGPASGTIQITRTATRYEGWMTNPKPLQDLAARNRLPAVDRLPILSVTMKGAEGAVIVASPLGLYPLRVRFADGGFVGAMRAHASKDPTDRTIRGSKLGLLRHQKLPLWRKAPGGIPDGFLQSVQPHQFRPARSQLTVERGGNDRGRGRPAVDSVRLADRLVKPIEF
ncbi:MAG: serine hydrolase domain-containing protein [Blastocatellia bacterium]